MPNLDFTGIASRELLPEGTYVLNIESVEEKVSSSGNPMYLIRFCEPGSHIVIFENYVLTQKALWKLKELTDALGLKDLTTIDSAELAEMLQGQVIKAKVIQDEYDGRTMNRVKKIFAL